MRDRGKREVMGSEVWRSQKVAVAETWSKGEQIGQGVEWEQNRFVNLGW